MDGDFLLRQINDALFPLGAYAHSFGLETYVQRGLVCDEETAAAYAERFIRRGLLYTELLPIRLCYAYAARGDLAALTRLERRQNAARLPEESRNASLKIGARFVKTAARLELPLSGLYTEYTAQAVQVHHCTAYGLFCAAAGIEAEDALRAFVYAQVSALVTNCVKLVPLSQMAGQRILLTLHGEMGLAVARSAGLTEADFARTAPGLDIRAMQHETLYSRLYMS
jgi:urease accessory protein